jgi:hypothetical protein
MVEQLWAFFKFRLDLSYCRVGNKGNLIDGVAKTAKHLKHRKGKASKGSTRTGLVYVEMYRKLVTVYIYALPFFIRNLPPYIRL